MNRPFERETRAGPDGFSQWERSRALLAAQGAASAIRRWPRS